MGVRLLQGPDQIQHIPLDLGSPLVHASAADPYVMVLSGDGQVIMLTLRDQPKGLGKLSVSRPSGISLVKIYAFSYAIFTVILYHYLC